MIILTDQFQKSSILETIFSSYFLNGTTWDNFDNYIRQPNYDLTVSIQLENQITSELKASERCE